MGAAAGLLLILIGVMFFTQTTVGDAVARIQSYSTGKRPDSAGPRSSAFVPRGGGSKRAKFVELLKSQAGDTYVFGGEVKPGTKNPDRYDCSEFIEWAMNRLGFDSFPDGSAAQIDHARRLTVRQARRMAGAVLYKPGHIAVSQGNGKTIEARNSQAGVGEFSASDIKWTRGGIFPELV